MPTTLSESSTETIIRLPSLHPAQRTVESEAKRFNVLACGRRWGKSKYLTRRAIHIALAGKRYGYFAATYKLLTEVWDETVFRLGPIAQPQKTEKRILIPSTGGVIECWTLEDQDAGRSRRYHEAGIDEGSLARNLKQIWFEAIRPTLTDFKGSAWLAGTPKGKDFFWEAFSYGQDPLNEAWASWQMPTATNPYIDPEEIEAARIGINGVGGMPDRSFRQEYLAEFIDEAGGVFRGIRECIVPGKRENAEGVHGCVIGVDLARVEDFTVISAFNEAGRQVYFERFNQIAWERQIAAIQSVYQRFPGSKVLLDSTGVGDPIFEQLRKLGINIQGYQFTNASKESLIDNLAMMIEQQRLQLMDIPEQTHELQAYQYEITPSRNVRMNAPVGMHDDCVIALALAAWQLSNRKKQVSIIASA